jgi:hypothetical protein
LDELNELAIQLTTLHVQIDALGGEYHAVTLAVVMHMMLCCLSKKKTQKKQYGTEDQQSSINQSIL